MRDARRAARRSLSEQVNAGTQQTCGGLIPNHTVTVGDQTTTFRRMHNPGRGHACAIA